MTDEQEQVLLIRQADQRGAHQRPLRQIKRRLRQALRELPRLALSILLPTQIVNRQRQRVCRQNVRLRLPSTVTNRLRNASWRT